MTALDRLTANPPPERHEIGAEDGDTCNRYPAESGDEPQGYKAEPCQGVMSYDPRDGELCCERCGEIAQ